MSSEILDLPFTHTRTSPVFVIGAARSGTSLLGSLIRRYLRVNFGTESQFLVRFYHRLVEYGDLHHDQSLKRLIDDIARERCFERWTLRFGFVLNPATVFERVAAGPRGYPQILNAIFLELAQYQGMSRWGDKTPEYNHDLPVLLSLFPKAQFVHIVRDGRDVALSTFKVHFGATNAYRAALDWRRTQLRIAHFAAGLPADQLLTLHYEDLLGKPLDTLLQLAEFFGIPPNEEAIAGMANDVPRRVRAGRSHWQEHMPAAQQRLYERIAADQLEAAGYETSHVAAPALGRVERLYWEADHLMRKAVRQQAWADNMYRAAVRVRMLSAAAR